MSTQTAVSVFEVNNPLVVLTDAEKFDRFYADMKAETDRLEIDLTTETGRKRIASMAFKVARTKTAIDEAGKLLTSEWRDKINTVDEARRNIRTRLDNLKEEVRRPLTEWEAEDETRQATVAAIIDSLRTAAVVTAEENAADVLLRLGNVKARELSPEVMQDHFDIAEGLRAYAVETLTTIHARLLKEADDRAELERLREAQAKREAEAAAKAEAEENAAREKAEAAAKAERERLAAEQRQAEIDAAAKKAGEAAKAAAEAEAAEARAAQERAGAEALAAEKKRADEAEASRQAEADRIAREHVAAEAEAKRLADEQAARDKDRKHRGEIMGAAKAAIMTLGADEDTAKKIVLAIVAGEIPAVTLRF